MSWESLFVGATNLNLHPEANYNAFYLIKYPHFWNQKSTTRRKNIKTSILVFIQFFNKTYHPFIKNKKHNERRNLLVSLLS